MLALCKANCQLSVATKMSVVSSFFSYLSLVSNILAICQLSVNPIQTLYECQIKVPYLKYRLNIARIALIIHHKDTFEVRKIYLALIVHYSVIFKNSPFSINWVSYLPHTCYYEHALTKVWTACGKISTRLYFLKHSKRENVAIKEFVTIYVTCLRPITEYACPVFTTHFPAILSVR